MVYTREQRSLFSLKIQELILYYIASIFSLFYLKIQSMILFYTKESSLPLFSLKTNALIRYYIQDSILPLFSFNVKYGLPRPPSPPSDIEPNSPSVKNVNLALLIARLFRAKAITLQSSVMGNFAWARGLYANAHARAEGM